MIIKTDTQTILIKNFVKELKDKHLIKIAIFNYVITSFCQKYVQHYQHFQKDSMDIQNYFEIEDQIGYQYHLFLKLLFI